MPAAITPRPAPASAASRRPPSRKPAAAPAASGLGALRRAVKRIGAHAADAFAGRDLSGALDLADILQDWADSVRARARILLKDGEEVPGWHLRENAPTREVVDTLLAFQRSGLPFEAFLACCKAHIGKLKDTLHLGVDADRLLAHRLGEALRETPKAATLARV